MKSIIVNFPTTKSKIFFLDLVKENILSKNIMINSIFSTFKDDPQSEPLSTSDGIEIIGFNEIDKEIIEKLLNNKKVKVNDYLLIDNHEKYSDVSSVEYNQEANFFEIISTDNLKTLKFDNLSKINSVVSLLIISKNGDNFKCSSMLNVPQIIDISNNENTCDYLHYFNTIAKSKNNIPFNSESLTPQEQLNLVGISLEQKFNQIIELKNIKKIQEYELN